MQQKRCGIIGSGNGIRMNPTLVRIFEKKFGTQMKIPKHMEEASFGAALFGLISCNVLKDASEARKLIQYTNFS
jgi:sedoheptulokinase